MRFNNIDNIYNLDILIFNSIGNMDVYITPSGLILHYIPPGAVAESVEHRPHVREIVSSNTDQVKPMTYKIDTCRLLARRSALLD